MISNTKYLQTPSKGKGFRKIDNDIFAALISADLTSAGYKVVLFVIHKTLGFQRTRAGISLSEFEEATGISQQSVKKAIKQTENMKIITAVRNGTRKTIYALNGNIEKWQNRKSLGNQITPDLATKSPKARQLATPVTVPVKKHYKETLKENNALFVIEKGVSSTSKDVKETILYYLKTYQKYKGQDHPRLKEVQWRRVIEMLETFCDCGGWIIDFSCYRDMIDCHFKRKLKTDHNINHFATQGILENLLYKIGYY